MEELESLEKSKCVRCGKPNKNGGKGGRCSSCLKKLSTKRQTPGSKERAWKHADQAIRREKGSSGTTTGGHKSGHGKRQEIQRKMQAAEKKSGAKLSLDRKNNERGYEGKNTRAVPEKLNRGRHKVDPKKLKAWKERVKKSDIELDDFMTLLVLKMKEQEKDLLLKSLSGFTVEEIADIIDYITGTEDLESTI